METMEIQDRKKILINRISKVEDESVLSELEHLINKRQPMQRFSREELRLRALQSLDDAKHNRVISQEDLEKECEKW